MPSLLVLRWEATLTGSGRNLHRNTQHLDTLTDISAPPAEKVNDNKDSLDTVIEDIEK